MSGLIALVATGSMWSWIVTFCGGVLREVFGPSRDKPPGSGYGDFVFTIVPWSAGVGMAYFITQMARFGIDGIGSSFPWPCWGAIGVAALLGFSMALGRLIEEVKHGARRKGVLAGAEVRNSVIASVLGFVGFAIGLMLVKVSALAATLKADPTATQAIKDGSIFFLSADLGWVCLVAVWVVYFYWMTRESAPA